MKLRDLLKEKIVIDVEIGDTIKVGKFKNKKIVVKTIEYDEMGLPIINGRKGVTFKIEPRPNIYEDEMLESPDHVDGHELNWDESGTHAFGMFRGTLYLSKEKGHHIAMKPLGIGRGGYKYSGRLWGWGHVISFWDYPSKQELKKMIAELNKLSKKMGYGWKIDNKWLIEIVADKDGQWIKNIAGEMIWDVAWLEGHSVLIPIGKFAYSEKRTKSDKGKTHMLSPLLKKLSPENKKERSDMIKAREKKLFKPGMTVAQQKAIMTKHRFSESTITENPDDLMMTYPDGNKHSLRFTDDDAYVFGWQKRDAFVSGPGEVHGEINDNEGNSAWSRSDFDYPGRLWKRAKVITFWTYPSPSKLKGLIKQLNKAFDNRWEDVEIDMNSWNIEVVADKDGKWAGKVNPMKAWKDEEFLHWGRKTVIIPLALFNGSAKRSSAEKGKSHMISPLIRKRDPEKLKNYWKGLMKKKYTDKMSIAQQKAMKTKNKFSEDIDESQSQGWVIIGDISNTTQTLWPSNAKPRLFKDVTSADRQVKGLGGGDNTGKLVRYHVKPIEKATNYISGRGPAYKGLQNLKFKNFIR